VSRFSISVGVLFFLSASFAFSPRGRGETLTFNDYPLAANSYWAGDTTTAAGATTASNFTSGGSGTTFSNNYTNWGGGYTSWNGWGYSNVNNTTTGGYANQYAVYSSTGTGTGHGGSGNYLVASCTDDLSTTITLAAGTHVQSAYFSLTTYAALAILNGDDGGYGGVKKFTTTNKDFFKLTITGADASGVTTGTKQIYLADYGNFTGTHSSAYVMDDWTNVDLSALGNATTLTFTLSSSDNSTWGMNTPSYFAMDDLVVVPEPGTLLLLVFALIALAIYQRKHYPAHCK
jgi:hypothetical protein